MPYRRLLKLPAIGYSICPGRHLYFVAPPTLITMKNACLLLITIALSTLSALTGCRRCPPRQPCPECPATHRTDSTCCIGKPNTPYPTGPFLDSTEREAARSDVFIDTNFTRVRLVGGNLELNARVRSNLDDDCAFCTRIIVGLPSEVKVLSFTAKGNASGALPWTQCLNAQGAAGMITVESAAKHLCCRPTDTSDGYIDVTCVVTPSANPVQKCQEVFSVYAVSSTPDPEPANNYWYWKRCKDRELKCAKCTGPAPLCDR